jgi:curved DNA-binding protein
VGNNLYADADLDLYTALLGGEITLDTFDGKVKLNIPPETQSDTKVKLKGKGFPVYKKDNEFGDLFYTYKIKLPNNLTEKEKQLLSELSKMRANGK